VDKSALPTVSKVAADLAWANDTAAHYAAIRCPQLLDPWFAESRHTTAPINRTRSSRRSP